jgi:nucleotide-binding universal stress UspA family protein
MSRCVLATIDLGPSSARVLRHAAGFARLRGAPLHVLHVTPNPTADHVQQVLEMCARQGPYEVDLTEDDIFIRGGLVSEAVYREATKHHSQMVVMGSRGHGSLAKFILGSTTEAVLRQAPAAVLLVPPIDLDIINITDRATLTCGPVLAAVDLAEAGDEQLRLASDLAHLARQPLVLLTVMPKGASEHDAAAMLRDKAHASHIKPRSMIIRHGNVADEISHCALAEGAGLVVMGLRARGRGRPGAIASAVLEHNRAFVLAVPAS